MFDKIFTRVNVRLRGYDANGDLIFEDRGHNLVVTVGEDHVADQMADQGESAMSHMAVGTDNTAPAAGQTALGTETARVALDSKTQGAGGDANKVTYIATFGPGVGTGSLREAGIFNASSGGVMLARYTYVYDKGALDTLVINWEIGFAAA
jgi:hypothetical protein